MKRIKERDVVLSVIKAYQLLDIISVENSIGLTELSRKCGMKKTTVYRLLKTLENIGLIDQDDSTQQFFLTLRVVSLASSVLESLDLRRLSRPILEKFVRDSGKSILLSILNHDVIMSVDEIEGMERLQIRATIGNKTPAHCTACGKAILAYLPLEKCRSLVGNDSFAVYTPNTITDWLTFENELKVVRQRGFALDLNEMFDEITAVAVPLLNHLGMAIGAISITQVMTNPDKATLIDLGKQLIVLGQEISSRLGWTDLHSTSSI